MSQLMIPVEPSGYCRCGCGILTKVAAKTIKSLGHRKGVPVRYVSGHNLRIYSTGRGKDSRGRFWIFAPDHLNANAASRVFEHRLIVEKVLGRLLPKKIVVHHIDSNPGNNKNNNLVICENMDYHRCLHRRAKALKASGHVDWAKCRFCHKWDKIGNLRVYSYPGHSPLIHHASCHNQYQNLRKKNNLRKSNGTNTYLG